MSDLSDFRRLVHEPTVTQLQSASAAIERVRALHASVEVEPSDTICRECSFQLPNGRFFGKVVEHPCPTLLALGGAE